MILNRSLVVRVRRQFSAHEISKVFRVIGGRPNACPESSGVFATEDFFVSGLVVSGHALIAQILPRCANPQVVAPVVQRLAIPMIDNSPFSL